MTSPGQTPGRLTVRGDEDRTSLQVCVQKIQLPEASVASPVMQPTASEDLTGASESGEMGIPEDSGFRERATNH